MAQTKYTYSIATDTANAPNGSLAADALKQEYENSSIITALDYITSLGDVLDIYTKDALSTGDKTTLDSVVSAHTGVALEPDPTNVKVQQEPPFAAKTIEVNGTTKKLFKRVHGESLSIANGATGHIDHIVSYTTCKFSGAEIFNTDLGDTVDFKILDDANNTYSGAPGSNYQLNQFGFDVQMPADRYKNTSNYDADLNVGMVVRCSYTNNSGAAKTVAMNIWLHEVKD